MLRLVLFVVAAGGLLGLGAVLGWLASRAAAQQPAPTDRELAFRERLVVLDHHTELLERARQASLRGEHGLANIYHEAAERVLRLGEHPDR